MNLNNFKLLYKSFDFIGKISFLFNTFQSVFADLFYGFIYFLIFERLVKGKISLLNIFILTLFVFIYFIFLVPFWGYYMEKCRNVYFENLSNLLFKKIFNVSKIIHSSESVFLLQNDVYQCSNMASWSLVVLFQAIFSGIASSFVIGSASLKMLFILYFLGIIPVFLDITFSKYIKCMYSRIRENVESFRKNLTEYSNNTIVANIYNISDKIELELLNSVSKIYKLEIKVKIYDFIIEIINKLIYNFGFKIVIIVYGMSLVISNSISFGYLILSFSMVEGIIFFLSYIGCYIKNLQRMLISFKKVNEFLLFDEGNISKTFEKKSVSKIEFSNIYFNYLGNKNFSIEDLNLNLEFPNNYLITGENGKGKSTILKLIFGYLKPKKGELKIKYYENYNSYPLYVSQDTLLFEGSIYENLCLDKKFSDLEIEKSLYCVKLDDWAKKLDGGLNFKIESGGSNISKGEKMRLTIAIALLRNPQILFLDEPDANLDKKTILIMFDRIQKNYSSNLVVVSHLKENFDLDKWKNINI